MSFFDLFSSIASGPGKRLNSTEVEGFTVSTVVTHDMGPETAILDAHGTHPVQRYASEQEAQAGHAEWVQKVKDGLRKITKLGYGDLIDSQEITLEAVQG